LNLSSTSGEIGALTNALETSVDTLSANSTGNVTLSEANGVTIMNSTGDGFTLSAGGDVTLAGSITASDITVSSNGGSILDNGDGGAIDLDASSSIDLSATGSMGSSTNALEVSLTGGSLSANATGSIWLTSPSVDLTLDTVSSSAGDITISTGGTADLIVSQDITATTGAVTLISADDLLGSGVIVRSVSGEDVSLSASGYLDAEYVNLVASDALDVTLGDLSLFAIKDLSGASLTGTLVSGGDVVVSTSAGYLKIGSIDTGAMGLGDLSLTSGTSLTIFSGSTLTSQEMSLTASNGTITGLNVTLESLNSQDMTLQASDDINIQGTLTSSFDLLIRSTTGEINLDTVGAFSTITADNITIDTVDNSQTITIAHGGTSLTATGSGSDLNTYDDDGGTPFNPVNPGDTLLSSAGAGGIITIDGDFASAAGSTFNGRGRVQ
jgi:mucin-19